MLGNDSNGISKNTNNRITASFVLFSDLHFGFHLQHAEHALYKLPKLHIKFAPARILAKRLIQRYFEKRCIPHDFDVITALPAFLRHVQNKCGINDFDLYLLLGDLATWPYQRSYSLLCNYLTKADVADSYGGYVTSCKGLVIPASKLIAIPGTHDKMLLSPLNFYNQSFCRPLGLPDMPQSSTWFMHKKIAGIDFLFILVDANSYSSCGDMAVDLSFRRHLACGRVSNPLIDELKRKFAELRQGNSVDGVKLVNFDQDVRIMLTHLVPSESEVLGLPERLLEFVLPHKCYGVKSLLKNLAGEIDLLIHGHLHRPKVYAFDGTQVLSATTTSQIEGYNGFYLLKFHEREIVAESYKWMGNDFSLEEDHQGVFPFYRLSPSPLPPPTQVNPPPTEGPGKLSM